MMFPKKTTSSLCLLGGGLSEDGCRTVARCGARSVGYIIARQISACNNISKGKQHDLYKV